MGYELGPCQILYRPLTDSTGPLIDLGKTLGGVELSISETFQQLKTDQDGEVPVDEYITGTVPVISARLADISLANLAFTLKTTVVTDGTKQKVEVIPHAGTSLMTNGVKLVLKPYASGVPTTDADRWITLPKAGIRVAAKLQYDNQNQRVIEFSASGYPDDNGNVLVFGDESASGS